MRSGKLRTIIRQYRIWKSVLLKSSYKALFYTGSGIFWLNSDAEARMVIQDCKGVTANAVSQKEVPFEIRLLHLITVVLFKPLEGSMLGRFHRIDQPVALDDIAAGFVTGQPLNTSRF